MNRSCLIRIRKFVFLMLLLNMPIIMAACGGSSQKDSTPQFVAPESWATYSICNSRCSISIPNTLEKRNWNSQYSQGLRQRTGQYHPDVDMFQQKGLDNTEMPKADEHYCRVIVQSYAGYRGEYLSSMETVPIIGEFRDALRQLVDSEIAGWSLLAQPTYRWIDIDNRNKAVEIKYRRLGNNGNTTNGTIYLLFNSDIMVKMIVAYRESEAELWLPDVQNIIYTFKWK